MTENLQEGNQLHASKELLAFKKQRDDLVEKSLQNDIHFEKGYVNL